MTLPLCRFPFARLRRRTFALACAVLLAAPAARAETVRLGGTGSGLVLMQRMAAAFRQIDPGFELQVVPNLGSTGGLKALGLGGIQIAVISRELKPDEIPARWTATRLGRTPFVLATPRADVSGLSLAQIADIYSGRQARWPDGQAIRLVLRPASDGDTSLLAAFSPAVKEALDAAMSRDGMVSALTDQESLDAIERLPGALGTTSLALLRAAPRKVRALPIDGVAPTPGNVASGRYPYSKPLILVASGDAAPAVRRFIEFTRSPAGTSILADFGLGPER